MQPTVLSPNVANYQVSKGIVSFMKEGTSVFRDLGNVEKMALTPKLTTVDHWSSRSGVKKKDLVIVLEKTATVKIDMDEITADNIALMVLGTVDNSAAGGPTVEIFDVNSVNGWLRFIGTNDVGARVTMDLYNVAFNPSGDFTLISDSWNTMQAVAEVLAASSSIATAATSILTATSIANGDTVTIGSVTYTFQDVLTAAPDNVKRSGVLPTDLANLVKAINLTGISGTDYGAGTVIHPSVSAQSDPTTLTVIAKAVGAAGNLIATTETGLGLSWTGTTLEDGADVNAHAGKFGQIKLTNVIPLP
jgi:hypothetical protein